METDLAGAAPHSSNQSKFKPVSQASQTQQKSLKTKQDPAVVTNDPQVTIFAHHVTTGKTQCLYINPSTSTSTLYALLQDMYGPHMTIVLKGKTVPCNAELRLDTANFTKDCTIQVFSDQLLGGASHKVTPVHTLKRPDSQNLIEQSREEDSSSETNYWRKEYDEAMSKRRTFTEENRGQYKLNYSRSLSDRERANVERHLSQAIQGWDQFDAGEQKPLVDVFQYANDLSILEDQPDKQGNRVKSWTEKGYPWSNSALRQWAFDIKPKEGQIDEIVALLEEDDNETGDKEVKGESCEELDLYDQHEGFYFKCIKKIEKREKIILAKYEELDKVYTQLPRLDSLDAGEGELVRLQALIFAVRMQKPHFLLLLLRLPRLTFTKDHLKMNLLFEISQTELDFINVSSNIKKKTKEEMVTLLMDKDEETVNQITKSMRGGGMTWEEKWNIIDRLSAQSIKTVCYQTFECNDIVNELFPDNPSDDVENQDPDQPELLADVVQQDNQESKTKKSAQTQLTPQAMDEKKKRKTDLREKLKILSQCTRSTQEQVEAHLETHNKKEYYKLFHLKQFGEEKFSNSDDCLKKAQEKYKLVKKMIGVDQYQDSNAVLAPKQKNVYIQVRYKKPKSTVKKADMQTDGVDNRAPQGNAGSKTHVQIDEETSKLIGEPDPADATLLVWKYDLEEGWQIHKSENIDRPVAIGHKQLDKDRKQMLNTTFDGKVYWFSEGQLDQSKPRWQQRQEQMEKMQKANVGKLTKQALASLPMTSANKTSQLMSTNIEKRTFKTKKSGSTPNVEESKSGAKATKKGKVPYDKKMESVLNLFTLDENYDVQRICQVNSSLKRYILKDTYVVQLLYIKDNPVLAVSNTQQVQGENKGGVAKKARNDYKHVCFYDLTTPPAPTQKPVIKIVQPPNFSDFGNNIVSFLFHRTIEKLPAPDGENKESEQKKNEGATELYFQAHHYKTMSNGSRRELETWYKVTVLHSAYSLESKDYIPLFGTLKNYKNDDQKKLFDQAITAQKKHEHKYKVELYYRRHPDPPFITSPCLPSKVHYVGDGKHFVMLECVDKTTMRATLYRPDKQAAETPSKTKVTPIGKIDLAEDESFATIRDEKGQYEIHKTLTVRNTVFSVPPLSKCFGEKEILENEINYDTTPLSVSQSEESLTIFSTLSIVEGVGDKRFLLGSFRSSENTGIGIDNLHDDKRNSSVSFLSKEIMQNKKGQQNQVDVYTPAKIEIQERYPLLCYTHRHTHRTTLHIHNLADMDDPGTVVYVENVKFVSFVENYTFTNRQNPLAVSLLVQDYHDTQKDLEIIQILCTAPFLKQREGRFDNYVVKRVPLPKMRKILEERDIKKICFFQARELNQGEKNFLENQQLQNNQLLNQEVDDTQSENSNNSAMTALSGSSGMLRERIKQTAERMVILVQTSKNLFSFPTNGEEKIDIIRESIQNPNYRMKPVLMTNYKGEVCVAVQHKLTKEDFLYKIQVRASKEQQSKVLEYEALYSTTMGKQETILALQRNRTSYTYLNDSLEIRTEIPNKDYNTKKGRGSDKTNSRFIVKTEQLFKDDRLTQIKPQIARPFSLIRLNKSSINFRGQMFTLDENEPTKSKKQITCVDNFDAGQISLTGDEIAYSQVSSLKSVPLLGYRNDVRLKSCFITQDLMLFKMGYSAPEVRDNWSENMNEQEKYYWTILDTTGKVQPINRRLAETLASEDWIEISASGTSRGTVQLLLESDKTIATVEINLIGDVNEVHTFDKGMSKSDERFPKQQVFARGLDLFFVAIELVPTKDSANNEIAEEGKQQLNNALSERVNDNEQKQALLSEMNEKEVDVQKKEAENPKQVGQKKALSEEIPNKQAVHVTYVEAEKNEKNNKDAHKVVLTKIVIQVPSSFIFENKEQQADIVIEDAEDDEGPAAVQEICLQKTYSVEKGTVTCSLQDQRDLHSVTQANKALLAFQNLLKTKEKNEKQAREDVTEVSESFQNIAALLKNLPKFNKQVQSIQEKLTLDQFEKDYKTVCSLTTDLLNKTNPDSWQDEKKKAYDKAQQKLKDNENRKKKQEEKLKKQQQKKRQIENEKKKGKKKDKRPTAPPQYQIEICGDYLCYSEVTAKSPETQEIGEKLVANNLISTVRVLTLTQLDERFEQDYREKSSKDKDRQMEFPQRGIKFEKKSVYSQITISHCTEKLLKYLPSRVFDEQYKKQKGLNYLQVSEVDSSRVVIYNLKDPEMNAVKEDNVDDKMMQSPYLSRHVQYNLTQSHMVKLSENGSHATLKSPFTNMDLKHVQYLLGIVKENQSGTSITREVSISFKSLFCVIYGMTLFSFVEQDLDILIAILKNLQNLPEEQFGNARKKILGKILCLRDSSLASADQQEVEKKLEQSGATAKCWPFSSKNESEGQELKKLKDEDNPDEDKNSGLLATSVLQRKFSSYQVKTRDTMLQIAALTDQTSVFQTINDSSNLRNSMEQLTPHVLNQFNTCFIDTQSTHKIFELAVPKAFKMLTFRTKNILVTKQQCQEQINLVEKDPNKLIKKTHVIVKMLDISFIYTKNKAFPDFVSELLRSSESSIFSSDLVIYLLKEFWPSTRRKIFFWFLTPFAFHLVFAITYMVFELMPDPYQNDKNPIYIFGIGSSLTWAILTIESVARFFSVIKKPFSLNHILVVVDFAHLIMFAIILVNKVLPDEYEFVGPTEMCVLAALTSLFLMIKAFDWLRLFEETAFFIRLIIETVYTIGSFMLLFIMSLFMTGIPVMFLNYNRNNDDAQLVQEVQGNFFIDAILSQYLQVLNGFDVEAFEGDGFTNICVGLWLFATLFTQVTMLNMLIAIMSDTFDNITENRPVEATRTMLAYLDDFDFFLRRNQDEEDKKKVFLFVIKAADEGVQNSNDWRGSIAQINNNVKRTVLAMQNVLLHEIQSLKNSQQTEFVSQRAIVQGVTDLGQGDETTETAAVDVEQEKQGQFKQEVSQKLIAIENKLEESSRQYDEMNTQIRKQGIQFANLRMDIMDALAKLNSQTTDQPVEAWRRSKTLEVRQPPNQLLQLGEDGQHNEAEDAKEVKPAIEDGAIEVDAAKQNEGQEDDEAGIVKAK